MVERRWSAWVRLNGLDGVAFVSSIVCFTWNGSYFRVQTHLALCAGISPFFVFILFPEGRSLWVDR
uniref:Uncharacterized protein n=1 Tax=Arundo donax TaxID=35708 RepID=A0A0A9BAX6_ARUDO